MCAALTNRAGHILVSQRPPGAHLAGAWEFPGGKLEASEGKLAGLARELREELGVEIGSGPHRPLRKVLHDYPDRRVLIEAWSVAEYRGEPMGLEGQMVRWCDQTELQTLDLLPADAPIVSALHLPPRLSRTSETAYEIGKRLPGKMQGFMAKDAPEASRAEVAGADFIVMSAVLSMSTLESLCASIQIPVFALGIDLHEAWASGATGVSHLDQI